MSAPLTEKELGEIGGGLAKSRREFNKGYNSYAADWAMNNGARLLAHIEYLNARIADQALGAEVDG